MFTHVAIDLPPVQTFETVNFDTGEIERRLRGAGLVSGSVLDALREDRVTIQGSGKLNGEWVVLGMPVEQPDGSTMIRVRPVLK